MNNKEYFDKDYFLRKNIFEVMKKGGYTKSGNHILENMWKIDLIKKFYKKKTAKLIDIGCGAGFFLECVPKGFSKQGIDISKTAVKIAKSKGFVAKQLDITKQNISSEKFDIITAFDTLEHITELNSALKNINKIMDEKSLFFVQIPIKTTFHIFLSKFNLGILDNDPTHVQKHNFDEWTKMLGKEFSIVYSKKVLYKQYGVLGFNISAIFVLKK